jgi:hypothetical protein
MTAFGGAPGAAVVNPAIENDPCSDAGAKCGVKNVSITNARTPEGFGQGRGISIVVQARGDSRDALHFGRKRKIPPARHVRWIEDHSGDRIEWPRRANANSRQTGPRLRTRRKNEFDGRLHGTDPLGSAATRGHRHTRLKKYVALGIHEAGGHFRSADVHT